ncbi:MAG: GNAT family N-acetyltransferase [Candidatus Aminicenantes bacterium]
MIKERIPDAIRNYRPDDFDKLVDFCTKVSVFEQEADEAVFAFVMKRLLRPHYFPQKDLFLALENRNLLGFMNILPESRINRAVVSCFILPQYQRKGIASVMWKQSRKRIKEIRAEKVHVCVFEENERAKVLLEKLDFSPVRRFVELRIKPLNKLNRESPPVQVNIDHLKPEEESQLASIQNKCFEGSWGFCPNTEQEIKYYLRLTETRPRDVITARSKKDKKIIGYCWTQIKKNGQGRIHMYGVHPDHRRHGIGRFLFLAGLSYLKNRGAQSAQLTVDEKNKPARSIYSSMGFKQAASRIWYQKR